MNTEQELRLLPCPFCGWKEPKIVTNRHANMSWVACADCGLETPSETGTSAEDAAEYWNRRSSSDKPFASPPAVAAGGVTVDPDLLAKQSTIEPDIAAVVYADRSKLYSDFSGGVTEERLEAGAKALCLATGLDWDSIPGTAEGDDKDTGPETRRYFRQWFKPALTAALAVGDEGIREAPDACPVCAVAFKPDDLCQTDIELGTCHAACLEGSPLVDLETGEPLPEGSEWPAPYRYDSLLPTPPSRGEGE